MRMSDWSSDVCSSDLLDPASLPSFLLHFLPRGLDQTEPLGRPLAAPGLVILGKQGAMEFLEHIDNSLIALVASPDVRFTHPVRHIAPGIAASGQDHQGEQARGGETERLAPDEPHFDEPSRFDELFAPFSGEHGGNPHRASRGDFILIIRYGYRVRRSEEHTSELQSLMRISYAVFCLKKTQKQKHSTNLSTT